MRTIVPVKVAAESMITLYQLHWSHYVEKVRWALDYKGLPWRAVDVDPFSKRQMDHLPCKTTLDSGQSLHTVPAIQDEATGAMVGDSSVILAYLDRQYPSPALFPESSVEREAVERWVRWLDAVVGLAARRLAYTQIALEHPGYLAHLFVPDRVAEASGNTFKAQLAGVIIAGTLTQRFRFYCNREDSVFEKLEQCLLFAAACVGANRFLVGEQFTAADLTLAALLRPVTLVPFFRDHPRLRGLFQWRAALLREHGREANLGYEKALHAVRTRRGWELGTVSWLEGEASASILKEVPADVGPRNDQQPVSRWPVVMGPLWYLRLWLTSGLGRTEFLPNAAQRIQAR